jgi:hypothetical protein
MAEIKYRSVPHKHGAFLKKARKRRGFQAAQSRAAVEHQRTNHEEYKPKTP